MDCFSACTFEVVNFYCLDTVSLSTIQHIDRSCTFFCFPVDGVIPHDFVFCCGHHLHLWAHGGLASLRLRKIPPTYWDGGCPLCDQLASVIGDDHCGGGMSWVVENWFCEFPGLPPFH